ncbi:cysteine protease StiP family protein [Endozoicomonas ascidiicola]|uniref:cysteine protease StiP family protein n=1 Tax=Endozoicomonas ascidiicola TaxID=1698521 RepID=UPI0008349024|nr:cysteine protease StiP family protein [Endozoicomonas ascidiicola]
MNNFKPEAGNYLKPLCGSYSPEDCLFLLKPVSANYKSVEDKERLIQQGTLHYSQMIHRESEPSDIYTELFYSMLSTYKSRLAEQVMRLALEITQRRTGPVTLVSLARAGTPFGVLLYRALTRHFDRESTHYSISIIRDRGIDAVALDYLLSKGHLPESFVFIDGWTAKGVITEELKKSVVAYNVANSVNISSELFVISDIGGTADVAATYDDYAIPSALMNSTVSGLVSRSILNEQIGRNDFHGCVVYDHLREHDLSGWFVDQVSAELSLDRIAPLLSVPRQERREITTNFLNTIMSEMRVSDLNRVKPGIAEATRVMLRRVPDLLIVQQSGHPDIAHLERLAVEKSIQVIERADMPFGACALIRDVLETGSNNE